MVRSPAAASAALPLLVALGLAGAGCMTPSAPPGLSRTQSDPPTLDETHPPRLDEVRFESDGSALYGIVYVAQGEGPHPTAVLLHGLPGNERNLDLAQALRRTGWNVVYFTYRGAWGSEGRFSFAHVLEDAAAVVETVRRPDFAANHRADPSRIALVGHSLGGVVALTVGREQEDVTCIVSLAGANLGAVGASSEKNAAQARGLTEAFAAWGGPLGDPDPEALVAELEDMAERLDPTRHAEALARKPVFLVGGERDRTTPIEDHHMPLVTALAAQEEPRAQHAVLAGADHAFSGKRVLLAELVAGWLDRACVASGSAPEPDSGSPADSATGSAAGAPPAEPVEGSGEEAP